MTTRDIKDPASLQKPSIFYLVSLSMNQVQKNTVNELASTIDPDCSRHHDNLNIGGLDEGSKGGTGLLRGSADSADDSCVPSGPDYGRYMCKDGIKGNRRRRHQRAGKHERHHHYHHHHHLPTNQNRYGFTSV